MIHIIPEKKVPGKRLGRHVYHDPKSLRFEHSMRSAPIVSKTWLRTVPAFDQGDIGSCTGNAMAGVLATAPFHETFSIDESTAVELYKEATRIDRIPGYYPPNDTGSTGIAVAKAAYKKGWISSYHHAFGLHSCLTALSHIGPVIIGIPWYDGFDTPQGSSALLQISGTVRGGHEVQLLGVDTSTQVVHGINSWGPNWVANGRFTMSFKVLDFLLKNQGDCIVPIL